MEDNNDTNVKFLEWLRKNCPNLLSKALADHQFLNGGNVDISSLTPNLTGHHLNRTNIFSTGTAIISKNLQHEPLSSQSSSNTMIIDDDHSSSSYPGPTGSLVSSPFPMHRKKFDPNFATSDMNFIINGGGSNDFETEDSILTMLATTVAPRNIHSDNEEPALSQEHILQSHSESNRNAFIYVAVILSIYLFAVACIAIQFYRKHQTFDPFSAYMLGRNKKTKNSRDHHHNNLHHSRNQHKKQQQQSQQNPQISSASISPQLPSSLSVNQHRNNKMSASPSLYVHAPEPLSIASLDDKEKTISIITKSAVNLTSIKNYNNNTKEAADASKRNWIMKDNQSRNRDHHYHHQQQCHITEDHEQRQTITGNQQKQQPRPPQMLNNNNNNDEACNGCNLTQSNQTRLTSENFMDAYCSPSTSITIDNDMNDIKNSSSQYYNFNSGCHGSKETISSSKIQNDVDPVNDRKKMIMLTSNSNDNNKVANQILINIDVINNNQNNNNNSKLMEKDQRKLSTFKTSDSKKKSKDYYCASQDGCKKSILDNDSSFDNDDYEDDDDDNDEPETEEEDDEDLGEEDDQDEEEDHEIDDEYDISSVTVTSASTTSRPKIAQIPKAIRLKNFFSFGSYSSQTSSPTPPPSSGPPPKDLSQVSSIKENSTSTTTGTTKPKFKLLMRSFSLRTSFDSSATSTNSSMNTVTSPNQLQSSSEHHTETQTPSFTTSKMVRFQRRSSSSVIHSPCGSQIISTAASSASVSGSVGGVRYEETHL